MLVYVVVVGAARFGFGSLFVIVGQAIGSEALARFLPALAVAAIGAGLQAVWAVFITQLYRGVSEGTTGTCGAMSAGRSEEHTSELQSLMRNSYDVSCLTK